MLSIHTYNILYIDTCDIDLGLLEPFDPGYQRQLQIICGPVPPSSSYHEISPQERFQLFKTIGYEFWRPSAQTLNKYVGLGTSWDSFLFDEVLEDTSTWSVWDSHYFSKTRPETPLLSNCYLVYEWKEDRKMPVYLPQRCRQPGTLKRLLETWYPADMQNVVVIYEYEDSLYHYRNTNSGTSPAVPSSGSHLPTLQALLGWWPHEDSVPSSPPSSWPLSSPKHLLPKQPADPDPHPTTTRRRQSSSTYTSCMDSPPLDSPCPTVVRKSKSMSSYGEPPLDRQSHVHRVNKKSKSAHRLSSASYMPSRIVGEHNMTLSQMSWLKRRRATVGKDTPGKL